LRLICKSNATLRARAAPTSPIKGEALQQSPRAKPRNHGQAEDLLLRQRHCCLSSFSLLSPGDGISTGDATQRADEGKSVQFDAPARAPHPALRATFSRREKELFTSMRSRVVHPCTAVAPAHPCARASYIHVQQSLLRIHALARRTSMYSTGHSSRTTRKPTRALLLSASADVRYAERACVGELAHDAPRTTRRVQPGLTHATAFSGARR